MVRSVTFLGFAPRALAVAVATLVASAATVEAANYQDWVNHFNPNFYFELNETDASGGVVDSVSGDAIGTYNLAAGGNSVVGADGPDVVVADGAWSLDGFPLLGDLLPVVGLGADNKAFEANDQGHIDLLGNSDEDRAKFGAAAMTVTMFAKSGGAAQGGERIFTNNIASNDTSFQVVVGNDGIVVSVDPNVGCDANACAHKSLFFPEQGGDGFSNTGADRGLSNQDGWWHIVASTSGDTPQERIDNISLVLNGVDRTADFKPGTTGWGRNEFPAKIGGRRGDPLDSTTYSGGIDELAIYLDRVLTVEEAQNLYLAAIDADHPSPPEGSIADLNMDGFVDGLDLGILLGEWDPPVAAAMGIAQGAVPEPTTLSLFALAGTALLATGRRRS